MRITTGMIMGNYQSHLMNTLGGLESSRYQAETHRKFSKSYQDPSSSARANVIQRRYARNLDYQNNVMNTIKWQDIQEDAIMDINDICTTISSDYSLEAISGTSSQESRETFAQALREMQESMVQILNSKYGDAFVLGGNGGSDKAPFELTEDGKVLYRGIDVNDPSQQDVLKKLAEETAYVDLGFGLSYDEDGNIMSSSAFNYAIPGINVVGYGQSENGMSNNLIVLAGQMADVLEADEFDQEKYEQLLNQFNECKSGVENTMTQIGTRSNLLQGTQSRLEEEAVAIQDQYNSVVGINPAEAIMNYSWASYAYNSALKIGSSIIGPSLLDFMK